MRRLYIFLIVLNFSFLGFSQYSSIHVELVNESIGTPLEDFYENTISNDDGLNQILAANNISNYQNIYPEAYFGENVFNAFTIINCLTINANQLLLDLNAYDSVVRYAAEETVSGISVNVLNITLVDEAIGVFLGTNSENLIITNDVGLTQIFENFSVRTYVQYPDESNGTDYGLVCDCDAQVLKNELNNYSSVIANASDVFYYQLLSIEEQENIKVKIHPNPFVDKLIIKTNQPIKSVILYDILGKQVYKSSSITDFENFSSTLKSGIYLLKLESDDGETQTKKIIKA